MKFFSYKFFSVIYKAYINDGYKFAMVNNNKKTIYKEYIICQNENMVENEIIKKINQVLSKRKIGNFFIEIFFEDRTYNPCVGIWLPNNEMICEKLLMSDIDLKNILTKVEYMLTLDLENYKRFSIVNFGKYGKTQSLKNVCAFTINEKGKYVCIYDENVNHIKLKIDNYLIKN